MSATREAVEQAVDLTILILLGDKMEAAKQREISRTIQQAINGDITDDEAIAQLRPKVGDALDQALGNEG